jgi:hypothetical protein
MNAILEQAAAKLEANGWEITWNEGRDSFGAIIQSRSNGEIAVSVINGNLFIEPM